MGAPPGVPPPHPFPPQGCAAGPGCGDARRCLAGGGGEAEGDFPKLPPPPSGGEHPPRSGPGGLGGDPGEPAPPAASHLQPGSAGKTRPAAVGALGKGGAGGAEGSRWANPTPGASSAPPGGAAGPLGAPWGRGARGERGLTGGGRTWGYRGGQRRIRGAQPRAWHLSLGGTAPAAVPSSRGGVQPTQDTPRVPAPRWDAPGGSGVGAGPRGRGCPQASGTGGQIWFCAYFFFYYYYFFEDKFGRRAWNEASPPRG